MTRAGGEESGPEMEGLSRRALGDVAAEELPAPGSHRGCPPPETSAAPVFVILPRGGIPALLGALSPG